MVVHPSRGLAVRVAYGGGVLLTPDGRADVPVHAGDVVTIHASELRATLVRLLHNDFYDTLNEKFNLPLRAGKASR